MIELHTVPTANGQKVAIALEETGLSYRATMVDLAAGEQKTPEFRALNPFAKAPVLHDPEGPDGAPIAVFETAAMVRYVAAKAGGALLGRDAREVAEMDAWASALSASVAMPFAMQFFATQLAPEPQPWLAEVMTGGCLAALDVFEARLADRAFVMGDRFTYVDSLAFPVLATSAGRLEGAVAARSNVARYVAEVGGRAAVKRAMALR